MTVIMALCIMLYTPLAWAEVVDAEQEETNGGELFEAEHADPLSPYSLQIVATPKFEDIVNRGYVRIPASFKLGLPWDWDVYVTPTFLLNNPARDEHRAGVSDVTFGAKYRWKQWLKSHISTSTALSIQIPTGDHPDVSGEYTHVRPKLIFTKKVYLPDIPELNGSRKLKLTTSIGPDILYGGPSDVRPNNTLRTQFAADYPFGNYNAILELAWVTDTIDGGSAHSYFVTPGVIYHIPKAYYPRFPGTVHLGLGVRFGFGDAEEDVEYITRVKVDIPLVLKVSLRGVKMEGIIEKQWPQPKQEEGQGSTPQ